MAFRVAEGYVEITDRGIENVEDGLRRLRATTGDSAAQMGGAMTAMGGVAAAAGAAVTAAMGGAVVSGVRLASNLEQLQVSLKVLTGSAEAGMAVLEDVREFAAATPFELPELANAGTMLLAFGVANDQVVPSLRMLGDISSGLRIPIGELAELYGKARVQGRLFAEDINQLTGRGVPITEELAKQFGVTTGEVRTLVEQGKIGFPELQKALIAMTADGAKFGGMMAEQAKTLAGEWSTFTDNVGQEVTTLGQTVVDVFAFKETLSFFNNFDEQFTNPLREFFGLAPVALEQAEAVAELRVETQELTDAQKEAIATKEKEEALDKKRKFHADEERKNREGIEAAIRRTTQFNQDALRVQEELAALFGDGVDSADLWLASMAALEGEHRNWAETAATMSLSLDEEILKLQLGDEAYARHQLAVQGANQATLEMIESKQKLVKQIDEEKKAREDADKKAKQDEERKRDKDKSDAERLRESVMTEREKILEEQRRFQELLATQAFTTEEAARLNLTFAERLKGATGKGGSFERMGADQLASKIQSAANQKLENLTERVAKAVETMNADGIKLRDQKNSVTDVTAKFK